MNLQEKMFPIVQAWQKSGISRRKFLVDKPISLSKFNYWLYKYRSHTNEFQQHLPVSPSGSSASAFKPFILSESGPKANDRAVSMEIVTPSGLQITIYE